MPRMNYREVAHRFRHIDADFVGCEFGFPERECHYTVRLYPSWEHPLYVQAHAEGRPWAFSVPAEAHRNVTVYPIGLHQFSVKQAADVEDWAFTQDHPLLWQYEDSSNLLCNDPLSLTQWMEIAARLRKRLGGSVSFAELTKYVSLETIHRWGANGSFTLGTFPRTLFLALTAILDERNISYWSGRIPEPQQMPVLFLAAASSIIADDFEIDVPQFVHKPEWFTPS